MIEYERYNLHTGVVEMANAEKRRDLWYLDQRRLVRENVISNGLARAREQRARHEAQGVL